MIQKFLELLMMLYLNSRVIITEEAHNHTILDFHKKDIPITNHLQLLGNITLIQEFMDLLIMPGLIYLVIITEEVLNLGILIIIILKPPVLIIQDFHKKLTDLMIHLQ